MANGIFMGGEKNIGFGKKQIRDLVAFIKTQQEKFAEQAGKLNIWDKFGDVVQAGLSLTGVPGMVIGSISDFLIDTIASEVTMGGTKAGDPEAIKKLETAYTGGGFGEEFETMIGEAKVDPWESFIANALEGVGGYAAGEGLDWISEFGDILPKGETVKDTGFFAREGGYVPKKYYGGGSVQGGVPTISDYFNRQGKSLGGSNNESLAEMLGRN